MGNKKEETITVRYDDNFTVDENMYSVSLSGEEDFTVTTTGENSVSMSQDVRKFLKNLLDPEMFGHAVTAEVRDEARKLLGMKPVETTNWNMSEGV